ncbi:histidine phosphatase family protein [Szabonella alba]|uniref:Histidine phosphatase family protein n=1 Tax=Szabonella alba TaxID=2804194 RepID=A0A8K0V6D6_9RHOB|nr:histidine phosphatase family protein [Szabonella alba]MBL4916016.1 histidine phosphatase family protein [Szabonella alba]
MRRLFWLRHGPTHARALVGWTDLPADLSDLAALARLSAALPQVPVISSDLQRAVTTADAIAGNRLRLPPDPALREIHFGDWEMQHHAEIADQDHLRAYWDRPGDIAPPGGDSWNAVGARVNACVDRLLTAHAGDLILVAHFGVILTQVQRALGITPYEAFAHRIDPLSLTELTLGPQGWAAARINHIP